MHCQTPPAVLAAHPELTALLQLCGSAELLSPAAHQDLHSTYIMTKSCFVQPIFCVTCQSHVESTTNMWSPKPASTGQLLIAAHQAPHSTCMTQLMSHATVADCSSQLCQVHKQCCCSFVALLGCLRLLFVKLLIQPTACESTITIAESQCLC